MPVDLALSSLLRTSITKAMLGRSYELLLLDWYRPLQQSRELAKVWLSAHNSCRFTPLLGPPSGWLRVQFRGSTPARRFINQTYEYSIQPTPHQ